MKTTKRLLSILLMLTMLVSMFTVMAFAGDEELKYDSDDSIVIVNVGSNGTVSKGGDAQKSRFTAQKGDKLTATPNSGYEANWYYTTFNIKVPDYFFKNGALEVTEDMTIGAGELYVEFTETQTPQPDVEANVTITIVKDKDANGTVKDSKGNEVTSNSIITLKDTEAETLRAYPADGCTVSWQLDDAPAIPGETYTLKDLNADAKLKVTFTKTTPAETKTLRLVAETVSGKTYGKVKYNRSTDTYIENSVEAGKDITVEAIPNRGYDFVRWESDEVELTPNQKKSAKLTFKMPNKDAKVTAIFTTKSNYDDENTLTLSVSGSRHGDVYYKWYGDRDYTKATSGKVWDLSYKDLVISLSPDSGYEVVWQIDNGRRSYDEDFVLDLDNIDAEDGSTLYVSFVEKGYRPSRDDSHTLTIDITGGKHGTVYRGTREYEDGDVISIKKNDKMTFKAKADKGYVAVWTYKGESYVGDEFTVKMGSKDATLYIEFMDKDDIRLTELPFRDVSKRDWYYDDVVYVYRKGYMDGMSSTRFGGELNTTRGQIVTILWRLTGEPRATKRNPFTDVSSSQYYYDAISWAYDAGVVDGFDARTFKPDQNVTREQLAAILYRYAEYMNLSTSGSAYLSKYRDADKIANWAYDAMAWANYRGLINGTSATRIDPKGYATRAQIAAILHRFAVEFGA